MFFDGDFSVFDADINESVSERYVEEDYSVELAAERVDFVCSVGLWIESRNILDDKVDDGRVLVVVYSAKDAGLTVNRAIVFVAVRTLDISVMKHHSDVFFDEFSEARFE